MASPRDVHPQLLPPHTFLRQKPTLAGRSDGRPWRWPRNRRHQTIRRAQRSDAIHTRRRLQSPLEVAEMAVVAAAWSSCTQPAFFRDACHMPLQSRGTCPTRHVRRRRGLCGGPRRLSGPPLLGWCSCCADDRGRRVYSELAFVSVTFAVGFSLLPEKVLGSWLTHLRVRGWKHLRVESRASVLALASGVRTDAVSGLIKSIARRMTQTTSKNTCRQDTRLDDPRCAMWHVPCVRECVIPHTSLSV